MDVVGGVAALGPEHGRLFIAVGVFDGLHRGHRYLLARLRREAARHHARPAVVTFDAHPDEIIVGAAPSLLCDPDERLARLAAAGVEVTVVQRFDAALRTTPYDAFIEAIAGRVELAGFLMTPDAAFGHERRGTPEAVAALGARAGFAVAVVEPLQLDGRPLRSGTIRVDIAAGDLNGARRLLGRSVAVVGEAGSGPGEGSGDVAVRFPVPVALPPEGAYRATLEPAWSTRGRRGSPRPAIVRVARDGVHVPLRTIGRLDGRIRIAFRDAVDATQATGPGA